MLPASELSRKSYGVVEYLCNYAWGYSSEKRVFAGKIRVFTKMEFLISEQYRDPKMTRQERELQLIKIATDGEGFRLFGIYANLTGEKPANGTIASSLIPKILDLEFPS